MSRTKTVYQEVEVEFDVALEEFSDEELIEELESRNDSVNSLSTKAIQNLYTSYITLSRESFEKDLKKFFRDTLNVLEY